MNNTERGSNRGSSRTLSTSEFGQLKGVTGQAIRNAIVRGTIKAFKNSSGNYEISSDELENYNPIINPVERFKNSNNV